MKRLVVALMLVAVVAACRKAQQQPAQGADTTQMADTGMMMMSDTAHMMAGDTAKKKM